VSSVCLKKRPWQARHVIRKADSEGPSLCNHLKIHGLATGALHGQHLAENLRVLQEDLVRTHTATQSATSGQETARNGQHAILFGPSASGCAGGWSKTCTTWSCGSAPTACLRNDRRTHRSEPDEPEPLVDRQGSPSVAKTP
jgi:hypothetical protein